MADVREGNTVDTYNEVNFQSWKMHIGFIFQSRELFLIANGTVKMSDMLTDAEKL